MRLWPAAAVLALAACGGAAIGLADDPVARASQCSAVKALELQAGKASDAPQSFAAFTQIMHYAMISAARAGEAVDLRQLMTVGQNAPVVMEELRGRNWQSLARPCAEAFPEAQRPAGELPPDSFQAGMICFGLADFLARTAADHPRERDAAAALADRALGAATPGLSQRAANNDDALRLSDRFMAQAFLAGTPSSLLGRCARRFAARAG